MQQSKSILILWLAQFACQLPWQQLDGFLILEQTEVFSLGRVRIVVYSRLSPPSGRLVDMDANRELMLFRRLARFGTTSSHGKR